MKRNVAKALFALGADRLLSCIADRFYVKRSGQGRMRMIKRVSHAFQVLTFHQVSPDTDGIFDPIHPSVFENIVRYISNRYDVLSAHDAAARSRSCGLSKRTMVITFDDGYADNHKYALPVLKKYGVPATFFISTGPLDGKGPLWHDKLFVAFAWTQRDRIDLGGGVRSLESSQGRWKTCREVAETLRGVSEVERERLLDELCERLGVDPDDAAKRSPMMTWRQVRDFVEIGCEIGAHTVTHPILSGLDRERQEEEISECLNRIEAEIGVRPRTFSYPNGRITDFNDMSIECLKKYGVEYAYSTVFGCNEYDFNKYILKRGAGWSHDIASFAIQTNIYRFIS